MSASRAFRICSAPRRPQLIAAQRHVPLRATGAEQERLLQNLPANVEVTMRALSDWGECESRQSH